MYFILISNLYYVKIFLGNPPLSSFFLKLYLFLHKMHKKRSLISETSFDTVPSQFYIWLTNVSITFNAAPNAAAATL